MTKNLWLELWLCIDWSLGTRSYCVQHNLPESLSTYFINHCKFNKWVDQYIFKESFGISHGCYPENTKMRMHRTYFKILIVRFLHHETMVRLWDMPWQRISGIISTTWRSLTCIKVYKPLVCYPLRNVAATTGCAIYNLSASRASVQEGRKTRPKAKQSTTHILLLTQR